MFEILKVLTRLKYIKSENGSETQVNVLSLALSVFPFTIQDSSFKTTVFLYGFRNDVAFARQI